MARVSDIPTYKLQTFRAVNNLIGIAHGEKLLKSVIDPSRFITYEDVDDGFDAFEAGFSDVGIDEWDDQNVLIQGSDGIADDEFVDANLDYKRFCFLEGLKTRQYDKYRKLSLYGAVLAKILNMFPEAKIYTDFEAAFEVCRMYYSKEIVSTVPDSQRYLWDRSAAMAKQVVTAGLASCQLGKDVVSKTSGCIRPFNDMPQDMRDAKCAAEAWERARLSIMTHGVRDAHARLAEDNIKPNSFRVKRSYVANNLGMKYIYKVSMFIIMVDAKKKKAFIFDYAHLDQVRELMRSWYGLELYVDTYRVSAGDKSDKERFSKAYRTCFDWLVDSMGYGSNKSRLAKFMKTCLAILQNDFHDASEKLDMGAKGRSWELTLEAAALFSKNHMWHHALNESGATDREKNNLAYLFHLLPCPDADPGAVFNRVVNQMNNANKIVPDKFDLFMNYAKATDAAKFTVESKGSIKLTCKDGYTYKDKAWWKTCKGGQLFYPPEEEWGMCWVENAIPVPRVIDSWYTSASDVTRIPARLSDYSNQISKVGIDRFECNELLYTLKHAPNIEPGLHPSVLMDKIENGDYRWDKIADMSIKSENTKEGPKMRETWSGDAITREIMSEFDHAAIPVAAHYRGVTSRKTDSQVLRIFDKMCEYTIGDTYNVIVSTDISGWSPSADRKAWCHHHQYVFNMTTMCGKIDLHKVLSGIRACISKRGVLKVAILVNGLFQGWTGTLDTLLNNKVCLLATRIGKTLGYLPMEAQADTASLIDDAVQGIKFPKSFTAEQAKAAADRHLETTTEVWRWLSAEVSAVKTLWSTIKFIFLNRFHCEGSEVLTDMKTFAKVDRDLTRRLSTINQQCDTVIGAYRSAVAKGSDPLACYALAITRCCELTSQTNRHFMSMSNAQTVVACFAPRPMCGMGFPHFTAFCTKERVDNLTMFLGVCARVYALFDDPKAAAEFSAPVSSFISQPLSRPGPLGTVNDPWSVRSAAFVSHEAKVFNKLKNRMKQKCESKVIKEAFQLADHPICAQAVDALLKSYSIDAHILSAFSESMPEAVISAMIEKAHKADLILSLFPFTVRTELIVHMVNGNREQISKLVSVAKNAYTYSDPVTPENYIHIAYDLRSRYFGSSGYAIMNNTTPDPATMLARQKSTTGTCITVTTKKIFSRCGDCKGGNSDKEMYRNAFDGTPEVPGRRGFVTKGIFDFMPESARGMSPVQKCILKASQLVAHVATTVDQDKAELLAIDLWRVFCIMWGSSSGIDYKLPMFYINKDISWKRIDAASFNKTHPTICYPNSHNAVIVDAVIAGRMFDITKSQVNLASLITAAKTIGLIERAPYPDGIDQLFYSVVEEAFIPFGLKFMYDIAEEICRDRLIDLFNRTESVTHEHLSSAFDAAMTNYVDLTPAPEDYGGDAKIAGLCFPAKTYLESKNQELAMKEQLEQYFSSVDIERICLMPSYKISKKQKIVRGVTNADEATIATNISSQRKFEVYTAYGNKQRAGLQVIVELIIESTTSSFPSDIYLATWRNAERVVRNCIPGWKDILRNAIVAAKRIEGWEGIEYKTLLSSLGQAVSDHVYLMSNSQTTITDKHLGLFTSLLYFGLGKYRNPEMYIANARDYPGQMEKQWDFAARTATTRAKQFKGDKDKELSFKLSAGIYTIAKKEYKKTNPSTFATNVLVKTFDQYFDVGLIPDEYMSDLTRKENQMAVMGILNESGQDAKFDVERVSTSLDSVCKDYAFFCNRALVNSEIFRDILQIRHSIEEFDIEDFELRFPDLGDNLEIAESSEDKTPRNVDQFSIDAKHAEYRWKFELCELYMAMDSYNLMRVYKDRNEMSDPDMEVTEDMIDRVEEEWADVIDFLNAMTAEQGEMLRADEGDD